VVPKKYGNQKDKSYWTEDMRNVPLGNFKQITYFCGMFKKKETETTLPHWGDARNWVIKVIESCTTLRQINTSRRLVTNWSNLYYSKLDYSLYNQLSREMFIMMDTKWEQIYKDNNGNIPLK
jgi:hypothetical protein